MIENQTCTSLLNLKCKEQKAKHGKDILPKCFILLIEIHTQRTTEHQERDWESFLSQSLQQWFNAFCSVKSRKYFNNITITDKVEIKNSRIFRDNE